MAPFMDPEINHLMKQFYDNSSDPQFLYRGSQENIVKEMHAWVVCRQQVLQGQQELREQAGKASIQMKVATTVPQKMDFAAEGRRYVELLNVSNILDREVEDDDTRASYLLTNLQRRGVTWPELWWQPEHDGGVCSFLGTADPFFDADTVLASLQRAASTERFEARLAEFDASEEGIKMIHDEEDPFHGPSSKVDKNTSTAAKDKITEISLMSAKNTHPWKWNKIVKAVNSGNFPDYRIENAKLVDISTNETDLDQRLKRFLEKVYEDMEDEWAPRQEGH